MKANEAPLKLYISNNEKHFNEKCHSASTEKYVDDDIEYTRTDAFVKKACEVFCKIRCKGKPPRSTCTSLGTCKEYDEFKKALKGE